MVSIFNIKRQQILNERSQNQNQLEMEVGMLAKGIYVVKIQTKEGIESKKLVIQ